MHNLSAKISRILNLTKLAYATRFNEYDNLEIYSNFTKASDLLIVTLYMLMEFLNIHSECYFYNLLKTDAPEVFNQLTSRCNFNSRRRRLYPVVDEFAGFLATKICNKEDVYIIDSTPIEVCRFVRFPKLKIMQDQLDFTPTTGRNFIDKRSYAGYKLHAVVSSKGVIVNYELTQANVNDVNMLKPLAVVLPADSELIGDKGYVSESRQMELLADNKIKTYTASRSGKKATPFAITKGRQRLRKRIETCFSQLKDQFRLKDNYAKNFVGFRSRLISKIAAFTVAQYFNFLDGLPIGHVKYAL